MRMLIDLLNNELGYARIFAEGESFGYELTTYRPRPMADLFERMSGYTSSDAAFEAAQQQLASVHQTPDRKKKRRSKSAKQMKLMKRAVDSHSRALSE